MAIDRLLKIVPKCTIQLEVKRLRQNAIIHKEWDLIFSFVLQKAKYKFSFLYKKSFRVSFNTDCLRNCGAHGGIQEKGFPFT